MNEYWKAEEETYPDDESVWEHVDTEPSLR